VLGNLQHQPLKVAPLANDRCVVLCGRELCVYDMNTGEEVLKLKGLFILRSICLFVFALYYIFKKNLIYFRNDEPKTAIVWPSRRFSRGMHSSDDFLSAHANYYQFRCHSHVIGCMST
jgi:hypothetical protein